MFLGHVPAYPTTTNQWLDHSAKERYKEGRVKELLLTKAAEPVVVQGGGSQSMGEPSLPPHYGMGGIGQPGQHHHHTSVEPRQHRQRGGRGRRSRVGVQEMVEGLESEGMEPRKVDVGRSRWRGAVRATGTRPRQRTRAAHLGLAVGARTGSKQPSDGGIKTDITRSKDS
jgi:hypothetical protein